MSLGLHLSLALQTVMLSIASLLGHRPPGSPGGRPTVGGGSWLVVCWRLTNSRLVWDMPSPEG